jgi:hypothetical protein
VQKEASLQQWARDVEQIVYPSPGSDPLPHLSIYSDGRRGEQCGYINRRVKRIQEHYQTQEGCQSQHKPRNAQRMWATVSCQKFHNTNKLGRLFQVKTAAVVQQGGGRDVNVSQAIGLSLIQAATQSEELEKKQNAAILLRYSVWEWGGIPKLTLFRVSV